MYSEDLYVFFLTFYCFFPPFLSSIYFVIPEVLETMSRLYLVTEFVPGGELFTRLQTRGRLLEDEARSVFGQVVAAVVHMVRLLVHPCYHHTIFQVSVCVFVWLPCTPEPLDAIS